MAQVLPNDKFVCSFPRSGNTWLRLLITRAIAFDHRFQDPYALSVDDVVPDLHMEDSPLDPLRRATYLGDLRILKCHEPSLCIDHPMVYIFRRPEDTLTSLYYHAQTFDEQREKVLKEGIDAYALARRGLWEENVGLVLQNAGRDSLFLLSYEQLLADTEPVFCRVLEFLGLSLSEDAIHRSVALNRFSNLKERNNPKRPMFRAGVVGDSTKHMKAATIEKIDQTSGVLYQKIAQYLAIQ